MRGKKKRGKLRMENADHVSHASTSLAEGFNISIDTSIKSSINQQLHRCANLPSFPPVQLLLRV
jgi:hypothetical protein